MKRILLVHGMGRTPWAMALLGMRLRKAGFRPFLFGYYPAVESFSRICARLVRSIDILGNSAWIGVGHSLGGLLLRTAIASLGPHRLPVGLLTIGTPHHSPRLARNLKSKWYFRLINGDCGQMLASPERMAAIPLPPVPTKVIAGTMGPRGSWSPFGDEENDGVVSVSEVSFPGADIQLLPSFHTVLMNHPAVLEPIFRFAERTHEPGTSSI